MIDLYIVRNRFNSQLLLKLNNKVLGLHVPLFFSEEAAIDFMINVTKTWAEDCVAAKIDKKPKPTEDGYKFFIIAKTCEGKWMAIDGFTWASTTDISIN